MHPRDFLELRKFTNAPPSRKRRGGNSQGKRICGLTGPEKRAIRRVNRAGQTSAILDANTHDVEALHTLLKARAAHKSTADPVLLA
jgi:hypothetical protein